MKPNPIKKINSLNKNTYKANTKLYIPSTIKTQTKLAPFYFWADWAVRAVLKMF